MNFKNNNISNDRFVPVMPIILTVLKTIIFVVRTLSSGIWWDLEDLGTP